MSFKAMVVKTATKTGFYLAKKAPVILTTAGIGCMIAGTVKACECTTRADEIVKYYKEEMANINEARDLANRREREYATKDEAKDLTIVYSHTLAKVFKVYYPAIGLTAAGIALILTGHHIQSKRLLAMSAAYTGLQKTYSDYRKRVVDEYGKDVDYRFNNGIFNDENTETKVDYVDEDGNEQSKVIKDSINPNDISVYSVLFDEMYSTEWTPNPVTNMALIKRVQEYWNGRLKPRGFVYYYEILKDLGMWDRLPDEKKKQLIGKGWVYGAGDNYIDLGIFDVAKMTFAKEEFINGYEPSVLIDPNLDGDVATLFLAV